jgi:hypothetical protein
MCKTRNPRGNINQVEETTNSEYAFHVYEGTNTNMMNISIAGIRLSVLIDSGASSNIISEKTWEALKAQRIVCRSSTASSGKQLYAYASKQPLVVKGSFTCEAEIGAKKSQAEFLVIKGEGIPLLGHKTATDLDVLKIGTDISVLQATHKLSNDNTQTFSRE